MFCLFACIFGGNTMPHIKLSECAHSYSPNQLVQIDGKIWTFISNQSNGKYWMYSYEKRAGKFITTFGLFHLSAIGDFIQFPFGDGVDKIETTHDHSPDILENHLNVKLRNGKWITIKFGYRFPNNETETGTDNTLIYDFNTSIKKIK